MNRLTRFTTAAGTAMRRTGSALLTWLPVAGRDALGIAGLGAVAYGCWLLAPPAGFIVGGLEAASVCAILTAGAKR